MTQASPPPETKTQKSSEHRASRIPEWITALSGVLLALAGAWGGYGEWQTRTLNHELKKLEKQILEIELAREQETNVLQDKVENAEDELKEFRENPNTIVISQESREFAEKIRLETGSETISKVISSALAFYVKTPPERGLSPVNTQDNTVLGFGEEWTANGILVTARNLRRKSGCPDARLEFDLKIENIMPKAQNLKIEGKNLTILVDGVPWNDYRWTKNAGARTSCRKGGSASKGLLYSSSSFEVDSLEANESTTIHYAVFGDLKSTSSDITIQLDDSDPVDGAKWEAKIDSLP